MFPLITIIKNQNNSNYIIIQYFLFFNQIRYYMRVASMAGMAGVAGVASVQVCRCASMQVCKFQENQFSTARIMSDIFAMANAIYLRYDIHFTLFVCDMPSAFYSVIADLKSIFHRKRSPLLFKEGKKTPSTYICRKMGKVSYFLVVSFKNAQFTIHNAQLIPAK